MVIIYIILVIIGIIALYTGVVLTLYIFKMLTGKEIRLLKELELKEKSFEFEKKKYEDLQKVKEENIKKTAEVQKAQKASEAEHKAFFDLLKDPTKIWEESVNGTNRDN